MMILLELEGQTNTATIHHHSATVHNHSAKFNTSHAVTVLTLFKSKPSLKSKYRQIISCYGQKPISYSPPVAVHNQLQSTIP